MKRLHHLGIAFPLILMLVARLAMGDESSGDGVDTPDVKAIRVQIDRYVDAFNHADAEALAKLCTEQAEWVTATGERWAGRPQLTDQFRDYFKTTKNARLELRDTEIEILSPHTALETGVASVLVGEGEPSETRYRVVHLKVGDQWSIDSVREEALPIESPSNYGYLQPLEWMVGSWGSGEESQGAHSSCRWSRNRNFLVQSFRVNDDFEGTQIIGWDPRSNAIRSWIFDSDGGFGVGRWSQEGEGWKVDILHTLPDGRQATAVNLYAPGDDGKVRYQSVGRQVGEELLPSVGPIMLVRQPD